LGQSLIDFPLASAADSERLGAMLAADVPWSAGQPLSIFLSGDLGAGKTTVARGLLRALGVAEIVRSPSYTLLETYEPEGHRVLHLDLYRLSGGDELQALGLRDELDAGVLLLVEWPERAREALPAPDLELRLSMAGEGRRATLEAGTAPGAAWLSRIKDRLML
jgi:tRNA threonylcarbamoyladenosine biosynthesis protein TsaE